MNNLAMRTHRSMAKLAACIPLAAVAGCALLDQQIMRQLQQAQLRQVAHSRLFVLASICILLIPLAGWSGLVWGTRTLSLRSWWLLLTVECVLLAVFSAVRVYFE